MAMAMALLDDDARQPAEVLAAWLRSASELRAVLRRQRSLTTVFDAAELRSADAGLALRPGWPYNLMDAVAPQSLSSPGALLVAACEALLPTDPSAVSVFEELHAACEVLTGTDLALHGAAATADHTALEQLQQLRRANRQALAAQSKLASSEAQLQTLKQQLKEAEQRLIAARAQASPAPQDKKAMDALQSRLAESRAEAEMLLLQLHQTQEELELLWLEKQGSASSQANAIVPLEKQLAMAQTPPWNHGAGAALVADAKHPKSLADRLIAAEAHIGIQEQQIGMLHDELLHYHARLKTYEAAPSQEQRPLAEALRAMRPARGQGSAPWRSAVIGGMHMQPPHAHLDLKLNHVQAPGGLQASLDVRLVEHEGRPGLALFKAPDQRAPLGHWREHGMEGDRHFMLVVPQDLKGAAALQQMPSSDWLFFNRLSSGLQSFLGSPAGQSGARWHAVAAKLNLLLEQSSARLRYDGLKVEPAEGDAFRLQMSQALFGHLALGSLTLLWRPDAAFNDSGGRTNLCLLMPDGEALQTPPLACWPLQPQGACAPQWVVPVGRGLSGRALRSRWAAMSPGDRTLVLAILDALPAAVPAIQDLSGAKSPPANTLIRQAQDLFKQARSADRTLQLRIGMRRLLRR